MILGMTSLYPKTLPNAPNALQIRRMSSLCIPALTYFVFIHCSAPEHSYMVAEKKQARHHWSADGLENETLTFTDDFTVRVEIFAHQLVVVSIVLLLDGDGGWGNQCQGDSDKDVQKCELTLWTCKRK